MKLYIIENVLLCNSEAQMGYSTSATANIGVVITIDGQLVR